MTTKKFGFVRNHTILPDSMKKIPPVTAETNFRFKVRKNRNMKNPPTQTPIKIGISHNDGGKENPRLYGENIWKVDSAARGAPTPA